MDIIILIIIICAIGSVIYLDKNPEKKAKVKSYYEHLKNYFG